MAEPNGTDVLDCILVQYIMETFTNDIANHRATKIVFAVLYTILIVLGIIGNFTVIVTIVRTKTLHTVRNLFLINLACADLVLLFICAPITPVATFQREWIFGEMLCRLVPFLQVAATVISICSLLTIAVDRLVIIVFPSLRPIQLNTAVKLLLASWVGAPMLTCPIAMQQELTVWYLAEDLPPVCGRFCVEDWKNDTRRRLFGLALLILLFCLPLVVIALCHLAIYMKIKNSRAVLQNNRYRTLQRTNSTSAVIAEVCRRRSLSLKRINGTNWLLVSMLLAFLFCWMPLVVLNALRDFKMLNDFLENQWYFLAILCHWIAMSSTCWNPILYVLLNVQIREAIRKESKRRKSSASMFIRRDTSKSPNHAGFASAGNLAVSSSVQDSVHL